jgi:hypothetical protein
MNYVIHKTEVTPEDNLLGFSTIIVIILLIKTELYLALAPMLALFSIGLLFKLILFFKWQSSYAIKLTSDYIILNHTILYNKLTIPLAAISCLNREKRYIELNEDCNIRVPRFRKGKNTRISFSSLSDNERMEIFDRMEGFGIVSS